MKLSLLPAVLGPVLLAACAGGSTGVQNAAGTPTVELDPATRGPVAGVGIEGQDVVGMTDAMVRDMLTVPELAAAGTSPQVIIDSEYFHNESSQALNKNMITDRLRIALNRAAKGRMTFVGRHYAGMVQQERDLKRQGVVDVATTGLTQAQAGGDYRLGGRITSLDSRSSATGMIQRANSIVFEMVDLERGTLVWTNIYEFARAGQDDVVYR